MEKPYEQMDDLGGMYPYFWKHLCVHSHIFFREKDVLNILTF